MGPSLGGVAGVKFGLTRVILTGDGKVGVGNDELLTPRERGVDTGVDRGVGRYLLMLAFTSGLDSPWLLVTCLTSAGVVAILFSVPPPPPKPSWGAKGVLVVGVSRYPGVPRCPWLLGGGVS